jgi:hypothetical protein
MYSGVHMRIDFSRRTTRMAQQFLDVPQRCPRLLQMRSIAVRQRMHGTERMDPALLNGIS